MTLLAEGVKVTPSEGLVEQRPELDGEQGQVLWLEDSGEVVVQWSRQAKPYRVVGSNLNPVQE